MKTKRELFILLVLMLSFKTLASTEEARKSTLIKGKEWHKPKQKPSGGASRIQSDFAHVPDVSATCSASDLVVRVKPSFYGLGADAQELRLGSGCRSNGLVKPQGDLLFTYPVTACGGARELPPGYLVYKHVLHYEPSPKRFPSRAHRIDVSIECHYQRDHSVHQLAVQPTWQTVIMRKKLKGRPMDFQIQLMDDSWSAPAKSQVYLLGQNVNIQVSAPHLPPALKLYINTCYATPSNGSKSSLKYTMIDNLGCMVDSKHDPGASQFISRTGNTLRFSLRAFQFSADPETQIKVHCRLSITSEDPGPAHKSCTYRDHRWRALTGRDSICECCETTCGTSKPRRAVTEGFVRSEPLLVSDQPNAAEDSFKPGGPSEVGGEVDKIHIYTDINSQQNLWERLDVGNYDGRNQKQPLEGLEAVLEATASDLDDLDYRILKEVKDGSAKQEENDLSELLEAEDEDEITEEQMIHENQKKEDLFHSRTQLEQKSEVVLQRELEPTGPEEGKEKACRRDGVRRTLSKVNQRNDSLTAEEEKTWYFKWT